jgi:N-acetylmuramoyl-L-alanine amidase
MAMLIGLSSLCATSRADDRAAFQRAIVDYRSHLNPRYTKVQRPHTKYIIVHTSELGLETTLRVVSSGKQFPSGGVTYGGHAHYVIARNGRCYRILDRQYVADHAGRSMWNGDADISQLSIGIELVGYHYDTITDKQYQSVGTLVAILQDIYSLDDQAVLTHSQVAYGAPNRWFRKDHRGRKRCAKNFVRAKAGLGPTWRYDPDVRAGRLTADTQLAEVFYSTHQVAAEIGDSNIISKLNTAWVIAGEDYDSPTTVYKFPDGGLYAGDQIAAKVGWDRIPARTVVLLNQESGPAQLKEEEGPVKTIADGVTAWSLAGRLYNRNTTIYFLPSGHVKNGSMIDDWDDLPVRTRLIIGYRGPYELRKDRSAYRIAGREYNSQDTIYYLPSNQLLSGNAIRDFSRLQAGTLVFLPARL